MIRARFVNLSNGDTVAVYRDSRNPLYAALGARHSTRISNVTPVIVNGRERWQAILRTDGTKLEPVSSRTECVRKEQEYIESQILPGITEEIIASL